MKINNIFFKNLFYAIGAQIISLSASIVVSFIAPKMIDVENYAYWQLFLFYVTYINISRLGILDGLYLRLGGKHYNELNFKLLSSERFLFNLFQLIISIGAAIYVTIFVESVDRKFVFYCCCFCIFLINGNNYFGYILQSVNKTRYYSFSVIIQNTTWFISIAIMFFFKIYTYKIIVLLYIVGHVLSGIYLRFQCKEIILPQKYSISYVLTDIKDNISCGIKLMISNYASNLIIGIARIIIDKTWGVEVFGFFSFSITLANFFLSFVNQVSMVMFPALKRISNNNQINTYVAVRSGLGLILPVVMLGYLPICFLINWWLPDYIPSLKYLVFFIPICTFDGKMQMLCSTYFKIFRKENWLMWINIISMSLSACAALFGSYVVNDECFVAISLLIVIAFRSIFSEIILAKLMKKSVIKYILQESILVLIFITSNQIFSIWIAFGIYLLSYLLYLLLSKKNIKYLIMFKKHRV